MQTTGNKTVVTNSSINGIKSTSSSKIIKRSTSSLRIVLFTFMFVLLGLSVLLFANPQPPQANAETNPISITMTIEGYSGNLPVLEAGKDFTEGQAVKSDPRFMVDSQGNQPLAALVEEKEAQGYQLVWETEEGQPFDWFTTPVTSSITVAGSFQEADYSVRISFNDDSTQDLEVSVPKGMSFEKAYGSIPNAPTKKGHTFVRWVNSFDNSTFDFTSPVEASTTVYALFSISEPDQVATVDVDIDVPERIIGRCYIGATWSVHPAQFSVSGFTGELEGCSGTGSCSLPSAAAPSYTWADYTATLADINIEAGIVTYDVTITPPGVASPDGPRNSLGLIGYQTVYFKAEVQKNFGGYLEIQKVSENESISTNHNTYSLKDAVFGVYDKNGKRVADLITDESGKTARSPLLPVGTYTIKEERAPKGFAVTADKSVVINAGAVTTTAVSNIPQSALVDLVLQKLDAETQKPYPLGSASLKGAQFRISYYDRYLSLPNLVQNSINTLESAANNVPKATSIPETWNGPKRSWVFETDEQGEIHFAKDYFVEGDAFYHDHEGSIVLPLGTIEIEEIAAPEGYLPVEESFVFTIAENGINPHVETWQSFHVSEQVKRGDFSFSKTREGSMDRLANVPFRITSNTTHESHVLVTDENGMASTESSWTPHSQNTNTGTSSHDGIWFGIDSQGNTAPVNDNLGALPYDTYTVEELPCAANEGMVPVAFEVTISRNKVTLDLGTIDNKPYTPEISGEVDKRQTLFVSNGLFTYTIDYRSTSPTWADEFTTTDILECSENKYAYVQAIATPVSYGDYDGKMNVWYRTNKSDSKSFDHEGVNACGTNPPNPDNPNNQRMYNFEGWQVWKQDVSTLESSILFTEELNLDEEEYLTALAFEHGRVEEGFGTLPQDDPQWDRRDRYAETDTMEDLFDSAVYSSWDKNACTEVANIAQHDATFSNKTDTSSAEYKLQDSKTHLEASAENQTESNQAESSNDEATYTYSPAVLFMQVSEESLTTDEIELWNDAFIDIYRNIELHDEDKDTVVQTTQVSETTTEKDNPIEEMLDNIPKTGDGLITLGVLATLVGLLALCALIAAFRKIRHRS